MHMGVMISVIIHQITPPLHNSNYYVYTNKISGMTSNMMT